MRRREALGVGLGAFVLGVLKPKFAEAEVINRNSSRVPVTSITIVNVSKYPGVADVMARIARACDHQVRHHVAPLWRIVPPKVSYSASGAIPVGSVPLIIADDADQVGALGYHTEHESGQPWGAVFVKTIMENHGDLTVGPLSVSAVISHEVLEIIGDPCVNLWAYDDGLYEYAYELCDPVEGDAYECGGVSVSNFVLPSWFDAYARRDARFDYMDTLRAPFTMTPGGYLIRSKDQKVELVFGNRFPEWRKELKRKARAARR